MRRSFKRAKSKKRFMRTAKKLHPVNRVEVPRGGFSL